MLNRKRGVAGATITAGQLIYKDTSDSYKLKLADCNGASALIRTPVGMAINGASAGQPVDYIESDDDLTIGSHSQSNNTALVLGDTGGAIHPAADITTGWYPAYIGIVKSSTKIVFNCKNVIASGVAA